MTAILEIVAVGLTLSAIALASGQVRGNGEGSHDREARNLCKRIAEVRSIPIKARDGKGGDFKDVDPVYDKFRVLGDAAVPCLIDQLTNETIVVDPRGSPHFAGVVARVGDTAFWIISDITGLDTSHMVPDAVRKAWDGDLGVRAYFDWVKAPANRRVLQANVRAWWNTRHATTKRKSSTEQ
jgi:hypothetical protein